MPIRHGRNIHPIRSMWVWAGCFWPVMGCSSATGEDSGNVTDAEMIDTDTTDTSSTEPTHGTGQLVNGVCLREAPLEEACQTFGVAVDGRCMTSQEVLGPSAAYGWYCHNAASGETLLAMTLSTPTEWQQTVFFDDDDMVAIAEVVFLGAIECAGAYVTEQWWGRVVPPCE